jgi:hypothetical protein
LQQDIVVVADEAAKKYKEETRLEDLTDGGPTVAMLEAVKVKGESTLHPMYFPPKKKYKKY